MYTHDKNKLFAAYLRQKAVKSEVEKQEADDLPVVDRKEPKYVRVFDTDKIEAFAEQNGRSSNSRINSKRLLGHLEDTNGYLPLVEIPKTIIGDLEELSNRFPNFLQVIEYYKQEFALAKLNDYRLSPREKNLAKGNLGIRIVCMSDLHNIPLDFTVPDGDILIIAGDICGVGNKSELDDFDAFLALQSHSLKLVVAGNHDWVFALSTPAESKMLLKNAIYLEDDGGEFFGLKFWGSPWQPWYLNWAFNLPRGQRLADVWAKIPSDTDVLITHSPPYGILDVVYGDNVGCEDLAKALKRIRPRLHVFGHIHQGYGMVERDGTIYVNASLRNEKYWLVNEPIVVDL